MWLWKSCCVTRSERVNGWRLNPNITQALIPPIGLVLTWLDLFYSMWFLLGQMNGYGWPIYIAVKTSANLTNWDGLSLLYYHLVLLTLEHSGSNSWGIWNQKKIIIRTHLFIGTPSPWLTRIRFTRISLTRIFIKFPFLI